MNGKKLKTILTERGIKQKWVADKVGVTPQMVNQWVKEVAPIASDKVDALKRLLLN